MNFTDIEVGKQLSRINAKSLEEQLVDSPDNVSIRLRLLGYYVANGKDASLHAARLNLTEWLIDKFPGSNIWRTNDELRLREYNCSFEQFQCARLIWDRKVSESPYDPSIVGNAGAFIIERDFEAGVIYLERAKLLNPGDDYWPWILCYECYFRARDAKDPVQKIKLSTNAITNGELFLLLYLGQSEKHKSATVTADVNEKCACCGFWSNDFERSRKFASEYIEITKNRDSKSKSCTSIIGLIGLIKGDVDLAIDSLLTVDKTFHLDNWDLELANRLIAAGRNDVVINYLEKCRALGCWQKARIDDWIVSATRNGRLSF